MRWTHALVTTANPHGRPTLHPRLTVARAGGRDRGALLRSQQIPVVGPSELARSAECLAAERSLERAAVRTRLDAAAARVAHDVGTATSRFEHLVETRQALLDGADWARRIAEELPIHQEAVATARAALDARLVEQRVARQGLDRVLEQRAAAGAAMEDADRQLGELVGVEMDEPGLRRELEAAGQAVRAAQDAHAAAVARMQALEAERDEVEARIAALEGALVGPLPDSEAEMADERVERVLAALASWAAEARFGELDPDAQALASAFTDLLADMAELRQTVAPRPDPATLALAEAEAARAAQVLAEMDAEVSAVVLTAEQRAEVDAAHEAVLQAEERLDRRIGASAARRRHEEARDAERALLDRYGFPTYLHVVLSGGRASTDNPDRLAAQRAYLAATAALDGLRSALRGSPDEQYLETESARLRAHATRTLGVDPGDRVVELLRAHPLLPRGVLEDLRDALAHVGVHPVGQSLPDAAEAWLEQQAEQQEARRVATESLDELRAELATATERRAAVAAELLSARHEVAASTERVDLASRSVGTFETELSVRAGEHEQRLKRFAAAEQLRVQIESLAATLARAETEAMAQLDRATEEVVAAETALDRAEDGLAELAHRARTLAAELPIDRRPTGDPLTTLVPLAELLCDHAQVLEPEIHAAEVAVTDATSRHERAVAEAVAAGTGGEPPRPIDVEDALAALLTPSGHPIVVEDPFVDLDPELRERLLDLVVTKSCEGPVVLLTDDAATLGWAIELPAETAAVVAGDSLAEIDLGGSPVDLATAAAEIAVTPSHSSEAPAQRWAGHR